jgi:hypothetical protein
MVAGPWSADWQALSNKKRKALSSKEDDFIVLSFHFKFYMQKSKSLDFRGFPEKT